MSAPIPVANAMIHQGESRGDLEGHAAIIIVCIAAIMRRMKRMPSVSVFGSSDLSGAPKVESLCEDLGREIANLNCRIVCGGLGGVMTAVCRGAKSAERYKPGGTIGIIPSDKFTDANSFIDIVIPTGLGLFRNLLVARAGDACIGVRGGSGTLSEIAFAWQIGKPIAVMSGSGGWSAKLAGEKIDRRRKGFKVESLSDVNAAAEWLKTVLHL